MKLGRLSLLIGVLALLCAAAAGQEADPHLQRNRLEFEGVGTLANLQWKGQTEDRHLFEVGVSYERVLVAGGWGTFSLASEAVPLAILREPAASVCVLEFVDPAHVNCVRRIKVQVLQKLAPITFPLPPELLALLPTPATLTSFGMGASPIGIRAGFLRNKRVQPFVGGRIGFLYFNRNVLDANASQFNFTIDARGGVQIPLREGRAIAIAYQFQHMSNKDIAPNNPGMDSQMISVSYSFPLRWGEKR